eukprot:2758318-Pyramimonas_sp.AAC.1
MARSMGAATEETPLRLRPLPFYHWRQAGRAIELKLRPAPGHDKLGARKSRTARAILSASPGAAGDRPWASGAVGPA